MSQYPYKLQKDINATLSVFTRGDGFVFWRSFGEWLAQHPDMSPEQYFFSEDPEELQRMASDWMAFRRAQKENQS